MSERSERRGVVARKKILICERTNAHMKKAIIFLNGDLANFKNAKDYIKSDDLIICADGAAEHALKLKLKPNIIIGDFDSLKKSLQSKLKNSQTKWIKFAVEKNETDSELAIDFAVKNGFKEILIFGLLGSRFDHIISNLFHLETLTKKAVETKIIEGNQEIFIVNKKTKLKGKIGDTISLIPLKENVKGITTKGLKYKLTNEDLLFGYSRGVSNVFSENIAEISLKTGSLLIVHSKN